MLNRLKDAKTLSMALLRFLLPCLKLIARFDFMDTNACFVCCDCDCTVQHIYFLELESFEKYTQFLAEMMFDVFLCSPCFFTVLKNAFDAFDQEKNGYISVSMVGQILGMLGHSLDEKMLNEIVAEVDEDGSGQIEFEEFCTLAARFLVEEDAEAMQQELKEAFRLYDKEGK